MKEQLVLILLLAAVLSDPVNVVRLQQCCRNTIRFTSGFVDKTTQFAHVNESTGFTYKFTGVPGWLNVDGNSLVGQPPVGLVGSFNINVTCSKGGVSQGDTSFAVVLGLSPIQKRLEPATAPNQIEFFQDYMASPSRGINFIALYPRAPEPNDSKKVSTKALASTNIALNDKDSSQVVVVSNSASSNRDSTKAVPFTLISLNGVTLSTDSANTKALTTTSSSGTVTKIITSGGKKTVVKSDAHTVAQQPIDLNKACKQRYGTLSSAQARIDDLSKKQKDGWDSLQKAQQSLANALKKRDTLEKEFKAASDLQDHTETATEIQRILNQNQEEIANANKLIDSFNQKITDGQTRLANITAKREELTAKQKSEQDRLSKIFETYKQYEDDLQKTANEVRDLQANFSGISYQLQMNQQAKELNQYRVSRAKQELDAALNEQKQIEQGITSLTVMKDDTDKKLKDAQAKFYNLSDQTNMLRDSIMPVKDTRANYDQQLVDLKGEIKDAQRQKEDVEYFKTQYEKVVSNSKASLEELNKKTAGMSVRKVDEIDHDLSQISNDIATFSRSVSRAKSELNSINSDVNAASNYITLNYDLLQKCEILASPVVKADATATVNNIKGATNAITDTATSAGTITVTSTTVSTSTPAVSTATTISTSSPVPTVSAAESTTSTTSASSSTSKNESSSVTTTVSNTQPTPTVTVEVPIVHKIDPSEITITTVPQATDDKPKTI